LIFIIISIKILYSIQTISREGIKTEGVIFDIEQESGANNSSNNYPIVRFLTNQNIWITKRSKIGFIPGLYKKGKKVLVIYKEDNPEVFYIKDSLTFIIPILMISAGAIFIIISVLRLINI
jgi:hypothetical protein